MAVASGSARVRGARLLGAHALLVGIGWFVPAFVALLSLAEGGAVQEWVREWPAPLQGIGAAVLLAVALPFLWPAYLAIGWYESGLASRLAEGDLAAVMTARRVLRVQALVWLVVGMAAAAAAMFLYRVDVTRFVWLPLVAMAAVHAGIAHRVGRT